MLNIVRLAPDDAAGNARWDAFVEDCPDATFFHRAGWQSLMRGIFRHQTHYLAAEREGTIVGVLPLARVHSRLFGHSLTSLPFAVYGGVAATDKEAATALEAEAERLAQQFGVDHLELRHVDARHADWPRQDLYVTFRKAILADDEANLQAIPRKQRAMVRKGIQNGLIAEVGRDVETFFALYADNVHRHGTPALPKAYFSALCAEFGDAVDILIVRTPAGEPVSGVLSFYFRDEVLPYYAGDTAAARDLAANDFKYWELMRHACRRGLVVFDYGRSKKGTGSYSFKKNWGFEPRDLHYEYRLLKRDSVPQNNPANAKFRVFIALWRRLPIAVANRLGPHIVRNLG